MSASPFTVMASMMKSRSRLRLGDAWVSIAGLQLTMWRNSFLSSRSSSAQYSAAWPALAEAAASMSSRSSKSSPGASFSRVQSAITAARQFMKLQLLLAASPGSGGAAPGAASARLLAAAEARPLKIVAAPASDSDSAFHRPCFWRSSMNVAPIASSSSSSQSFFRPSSLRHADGSLSLTSVAALAAVSNTRLPMPRSLAATMRSKSESLSSFTKVASHFSAPHSTRSSEGIGTSMSPGSTSLWYLKYSTTLPRVFDDTGSGISEEMPRSKAVSTMVRDMHAAAASTSNVSPSEDPRVRTAP
mmetsp:Transcript_106174/g.300253  ORF Transcript_106174/g.300253 Transcript_106174/m.300253 type:complete len:302 (-) Transcript_106174:129-1034(-)